ncbi:MAG: tRNA pseudouridine(38-40) synthase TruA [Candidatus Poribacteria bacterium]
MRNIKLTIEYDGTNYYGWQIQPKSNTIQGTLEFTLSKITKSKVDVIGAGRTDAGVHAVGQVANFKTESKMTPNEFKLALNSLLPHDIVINYAEEADESFHSRFDAISRTYHYTILNADTSSAFLRNYVYLFQRPIDIDTMNEACKYLIGTHDFSSFASLGDSIHSSIRTVSLAEWRLLNIDSSIFGYESKHRLIRFYIKANAFLRGMVRAIVGTLLDVGTGKIQPEEVKEILELKDRTKAGSSLPAKGLCLVNVEYQKKEVYLLE